MARYAGALVVGLAAATGMAAPPTALCDLPFKDVARDAPIVAILEYRAPRNGPPHLAGVEVLKGAGGPELPSLGTRRFEALAPANGDRFLVALASPHALYESRRLGVCTPITVLALRRGKLRGTERERYDGGRRALTLDELRRELAALAGSGYRLAAQP
jgi:hypothetical protein